jgi:3-phenylpropionate/trans-cinnamate dioxygenase ferredoxin reductase subunit
MVRLESVPNALEQAKFAAGAICGRPPAPSEVPWFWSDQFDLKLIIIGVGYGYDTAIVRGSPAERSFSVCYLRNGELVALDSVNTPKDQMAARKLIPLHARPNLDKLADRGVPLRDTV